MGKKKQKKKASKRNLTSSASASSQNIVSASENAKSEAGATTGAIAPVAELKAAADPKTEAAKSAVAEAVSSQPESDTIAEAAQESKSPAEPHQDAATNGAQAAEEPEKSNAATATEKTVPDHEADADVATAVDAVAPSADVADAAEPEEEHWKQYTDPSTGRHYYVSDATGETKWTLSDDDEDTEDSDHDDNAQPSAEKAPAATAPADEEEEEDVWIEYTDAATGRQYYVNQKTKETRWTDPAEDNTSDDEEEEEAEAEDEKPKAAAAAAVSPVELPGGWLQCFDAQTEHTYYVNKTTKAVSWERPAELDAAPQPETASQEKDTRAAEAIARVNSVERGAPLGTAKQIMAASQKQQRKDRAAAKLADADADTKTNAQATPSAQANAAAAPAVQQTSAPVKKSKSKTSAKAKSERKEESAPVDVSGTPQEQVIALLSRPENARCADCDFELTKAAAWASINIGVFICSECSGAHRSLGPHLSKVRSPELDTKWDQKMADHLKTHTNRSLNALWEPLLDPAKKLTPASSRKDRDYFVKRKYDLKEWRQPRGVDLFREELDMGYTPSIIKCTQMHVCQQNGKTSGGVYSCLNGGDAFICGYCGAASHTRDGQPYHCSETCDYDVCGVCIADYSNERRREKAVNAFGDRFGWPHPDVLVPATRRVLIFLTRQCENRPLYLCTVKGTIRPEAPAAGGSDFTHTFDLTRWLRPQASLDAMAERTIKAYLQSPSGTKRLEVVKKVQWNEIAARRGIEEFIRGLGYRHDLDIAFNTVFINSDAAAGAEEKADNKDAIEALEDIKRTGKTGLDVGHVAGYAEGTSLALHSKVLSLMCCCFFALEEKHTAHATFQLSLNPQQWLGLSKAAITKDMLGIR